MIRLRSMPRATENNSLIPAVLEVLAHVPEVFAFQVKAEGRKGQRRLVPKGTPDILGVLRRLGGWTPINKDTADSWKDADFVGQGLAIETKATHRQTCKCDSCAAQRDFREQWEKRYGIYILARSVDDVIKGIRGRR